MLQRNSAEMIRNATIEVNQLIAVVVLPAMSILTEGLVVVGMAGLLFLVEPVGALAVVLFMGAAAWIFQRASRRPLLKWGQARQFHEGVRLQYLQEGLAGAKEVKLLGREEEFLARFRRHNVESARVGRYQRTLDQMPRLWLELLAVSGLAGLVLVMVSRGADMVGIAPVLGLFAAAAFRLMPSVNRVISSVQSLRFGRAAIDTLHAEFGSLAASTSVATGSCTLDKCIELDQVTYAYPGSATPAVHDLSIRIARGETVGFVGHSGSGKSTLVDLVLGLLTPSSGKVCVDGSDIQPRLRAWQNLVGYVPQTIYLTDDSLRRNVAFGLPSEAIDDEAVWLALRAARLDDFVRSLPTGLDTTVGERGVRLSGGQRQRIGMARALYHDPAVLVLDEATSALDSTTEREVMAAVDALRGHKTVLVVAHRLSTVERCDRLYRLEDGRIAHTGSYDQVMVGAH
jgi:ABC-type multidrug transport system fused ATPase/permease subunit